MTAPAAPAPPPASRQDALGRLRTERWHAVGAGETQRVAELDARIALLCAQSTPVHPARETTAAARPHNTTRKGTPRGVRN